MYAIGNIFRRAIKAPVNPLDKSTVVSIYPKAIKERKVTIEPGYFEIAAGTYEHPALMVVGPSSWWRDIDAEQPPLEIVNSSIQIADSFVRDWANGLFMCDMFDSMPGLFYIPGNIDHARLVKDYKNLLDTAQRKQNTWYSNLVMAADSLWARTNGNPLTISDDMRLAAHELRLENKPWMQDFATAKMVSCPACGSLVRPGFPICANCKTIVDKKLYDSMKLQAAS